MKRNTLALAAGLAGVMLAVSLPASADVSKRMRTISTNCFICHGDKGKSSTAIPGLAGMDKAYFIKQMQDFKSEKRQATVMHQHAAGYTDKEFEEMADFFAALKP
jgi:cytochrome c553